MLKFMVKAFFISLFEGACAAAIIALVGWLAQWSNVSAIARSAFLVVGGVILLLNLLKMIVAHFTNDPYTGW